MNVQGARSKPAHWCQQAFLQQDLQVLYVPIKGSVYGFRIDTGERINNWEAIHKQLVTAVVHPPGTHHIITGSHDMTAKVTGLQCLLFIMTALITKKNVLILHRPLQMPMQLGCSDWLLIALSSHQECPYIKCPYTEKAL